MEIREFPNTGVKEERRITTYPLEVAAIKAMVGEDELVSIHDIAERASIHSSSVVRGLHKDLGFRKL